MGEMVRIIFHVEGTRSTETQRHRGAEIGRMRRKAGWGRPFQVEGHVQRPRREDECKMC